MMLLFWREWKEEIDLGHCLTLSPLISFQLFLKWGGQLCMSSGHYDVLINRVK